MTKFLLTQKLLAYVSDIALPPRLKMLAVTVQFSDGDPDKINRIGSGHAYCALLAI